MGTDQQNQRGDPDGIQAAFGSGAEIELERRIAVGMRQCPPENVTVRYEVEFLPVVLKQRRALPKETRRLIGAKIDRVQHDLGGDVKKLKDFKIKYRLRAGNCRVLFELEGPTVVVYDVGDWKDIYE